MFTDVWGMDENPAGYDAPPPSSDPNEIQKKKGTDGKDYQWDGQNWRYYPGTVKVTADRIYSVMYNNSSWVTANEKANINIKPPPATQSENPAKYQMRPSSELSTPNANSEKNINIDQAFIDNEKEEKKLLKDNKIQRVIYEPDIITFGLFASGVTGLGYSGSIESNYDKNGDWMANTYSHKISGGMDVGFGVFSSGTWYSCPNEFVTPDLLVTNSFTKDFKEAWPGWSLSLGIGPFSLGLGYGKNKEGISYFLGV